LLHCNRSGGRNANSTVDCAIPATGINVDMVIGSAGGARGMKVLIKSAWGSDDPTKAAFAFLHANAFAEAGHEVRIFLLGEAVNLMKNEVIAAVTPVGWPPLSEIVPKTIAHGIALSI
jgi:hypothetical protein